MKPIHPLKHSRQSVWFLLLFSLVFPANTVLAQQIKASKNFITRTYKVHQFSQIEAATVGDIYYTQSTDNSTSVSIYGPDNIVGLVKVVGEGDKLIITTEKRKQVKNWKLKINISSPKLTRIDFKGVGNIQIAKPLKTPLLHLSTKGVGDIYIEKLTCDELTIHSMGVGNVEVKGIAKKADLDSKGVGDIVAKELKATIVNASSKGVGNITCYATQTLEASAKGVGSIRYKGNPTHTQFTKGGAGSIKSY